MKRILIFAVILTTLTSCAQNDKNMKTLVTYFSATGNTEAVAKQIADITGADIFEIRPEVPYSQADLDWTDKTSRSSVEMNDRSFRPAFIKDLKNHDDYDVIYIGFPIWWYTAPTIINSFVEEYGFEGKKVVMFATSGGSTPEKALKEFKAAYPEIDWVEAKLLNGTTEESIKKWIDEK